MPRRTCPKSLTRAGRDRDAAPVSSREHGGVGEDASVDEDEPRLTMPRSGRWTASYRDDITDPPFLLNLGADEPDWIPPAPAAGAIWGAALSLAVFGPMSVSVGDVEAVMEDLRSDSAIWVNEGDPVSDEPALWACAEVGTGRAGREFVDRERLSWWIHRVLRALRGSPVGAVLTLGRGFIARAGPRGPALAEAFGFEPEIESGRIKVTEHFLPYLHLPVEPSSSSSATLHILRRTPVSPLRHRDGWLRGSFRRDHRFKIAVSLSRCRSGAALDTDVSADDARWQLSIAFHMPEPCFFYVLLAGDDKLTLYWSRHAIPARTGAKSPRRILSIDLGTDAHDDSMPLVLTSLKPIDRLSLYLDEVNRIPFMEPSARISSLCDLLNKHLPRPDFGIYPANTSLPR